MPDAEIPDVVSAMSLGATGSHYIEFTKSAAPALERIVELPRNCKYVGLIHPALPSRDPSFPAFLWLFTGGQSFTNDLGELGRYYLGCATLMERWRSMLPHRVMIDVSIRRSRADLGVQARHCRSLRSGAGGCLPCLRQDAAREGLAFGPGPRAFLSDLGSGAGAKYETSPAIDRCFECA